LNKALLRRYLDSVEENGYVIIDASRAQFIDQDILETIHDFVAAASDDNITVELKNLNGKPQKAKKPASADKQLTLDGEHYETTRKAAA
jgi:MFS superfamily sulfate permease-like transporter